MPASTPPPRELITSRSTGRATAEANSRWLFSAVISPV
jgi:hypothetical protein